MTPGGVQHCRTGKVYFRKRGGGKCPEPVSPDHQVNTVNILINGTIDRRPFSILSGFSDETAVLSPEPESPNLHGVRA
jgi:hypothetical protein